MINPLGVQKYRIPRGSHRPKRMDWRFRIQPFQQKDIFFNNVLNQSIEHTKSILGATEFDRKESPLHIDDTIQNDHR